MMCSARGRPLKYLMHLYAVVSTALEFMGQKCHDDSSILKTFMETGSKRFSSCDTDQLSYERIGRQGSTVAEWLVLPPN